MDNLSLDTQEPIAQPEPLSLDTTSSPRVSEETAKSRTSKAAYGLTGVINKGYDDIYDSIKNGREKDIRQEAAAGVDANATRTLASKLAQSNSTPIDTAKALASVRKTDPETVFEYSYSKRYLEELYNISDIEVDTPSWIKDALTEIPQHVEAAKQRGTEIGAVREATLKKYQDIKDQYEDQGYLGKGVDILKEMVPGYSEAKLRGRVPGVGFFEGGLRGENIREQAYRLLETYGTDVEGYKKILDQVIDPLAKDNPGLALEFMQSIIDFSTSDRYLNNFFSAVDIATVAGMFKGVPALARKLTLVNNINQAEKSVIKSMATTEFKPLKVAVAAGKGDLPEAAVQQATADALMPKPIESSIERFQDAMRLDTKTLRDNPTNQGQELANRIADTREYFFNKLLETLRLRAKGERLDGTLLAELSSRQTLEQIKGKYPGWSNQISNISDPYMEVLTTNYIRDVSFTAPNGEMWEDLNKAKEAAYAGGFIDPVYFNQGKGVGFKIKLPVDELRLDRPIPTKDTVTPLSLRNSFFTWIRTPEDTLSKDQNMLRKITTYAPSILFKVAKERAAPIRAAARYTFPGTKAKDRLKDLEEVVDGAKTMWDPAIPESERSPDNMGYWFKSTGEMNQWYLAHKGRTVTDVEAEAYYAYKDLNDMDWILRNLREYTNVSRSGAKQYRIRTFGQGASPTDTEHQYSPWINAIRRTEMPSGDEAVAVFRSQLGKESVYKHTANLPRKLYSEMKEGITKGTWNLVEIHRPEYHPLHGFGDKIEANDWIRWIAVPGGKLEEKDLDLIQIPRRGGGHIDYDYDKYIKQANVRWSGNKAYYHGDSTAFPVTNGLMGKNATKTLNDVRALMDKKDMEGARALFNSNFTHGLEFKDFQGWFKDSYKVINGKKTKIPARFSLKEPFHLVDRDKMIIDMDKELEKRYVDKTGKSTLIDGTRQGSIGRQFQVQYSGQRDAWDVFSLNDVGTQQNPAYAFQPATRVSPVESMNRALSRIIHSTWMDDYKASAIENWVSEANQKGILDAKDSLIKNAPYAVFHDTNLRKGYKKGAGADVVSQFEANRQKILQFIGVQDWTNSMLHATSQKMADSIYGKFGQKGLDLTPSWLLGGEKDPVRALRSITFNAKMGLFSPAQFFVHAATFANVMGIAGPVRASQGAMGAFLHLMTTFNRSEAFLNTLDKIASKMRLYRPGEWKEAFHMLENSGFLNEAGEYAMKDSALSTKVIEHGTDQFLNFGQIFFRSGVRSLRAGSWYTAYKEMRAGSGITEAFGNKELGTLLSRADLFSHNMSRASNSMLHTGALSLTSQFYTYFLRLSEMMIGKRLTRMEKARLFGVNATLFGVPTAAGLWLYPFGDHIRDASRESGYVVGDKFVSSTLMEGLPAMLSQASLGIPLDFGERYGPRGNTKLGDVLQGDAGFWDILGGAAYTTVGNTLANLTHFTKQMYAGMTMDPAVFKPSLDEALDVITELAGPNTIRQSYLALKTGHWYSNKGTYVSDATPLAAYIRGITGLQDQNIVDLYRMGLDLKSRQAIEKDVDNMFSRNMTRAAMADRDNNPEQSKSYYSKAFHLLDILDYPIQRRARLIARSADENRSLIESLHEQYYVGKDVPAGKEDKMQDAYQRDLQMRGNR